MAFTYTSDPAGSNLDAVRFELGDTIAGTHLMADEEINYALQQDASVLKAAARCAESLAARFARETSERSANVTKDHGDKQMHFQRLARKLRARSVPTFIDNHSVADRQAAATDTLDLPSKFRVGMHNNQNRN